MSRRLIQLLLALFLVGLATVLIGPVAATMLTPGWLESADVRDWASMTLFLCVAAGLLLTAFRLAFRRDRSPHRVLGSGEWWVIAALSVIATVCAAVASHWTIALPGLLPIGLAVVLARRRARQERLTLVEPDPSELPPRATFTSARPSGKS
jgi:hypothetical protein